MLSALTIEGYRCFQRFEIPELRRVNLFVGRNNAGKSSALEAAGLLIDGGDPDLLTLVARDRREFSSAEVEGVQYLRAPMGQLFHGRTLAPDVTFSLAGAVDQEPVSVVYRLSDPPTDQKRRSGRNAVGPPPLTLHIELSAGARSTGTAPLRRGELRGEELEGEIVQTWNARLSYQSTYHIGVTRETPEEVLHGWESIVGNAEEALVISALQLLEPTLERVVVTNADASPEFFAVLRGAPARVPFSSLGEGAWRLLGLAVDLASIKSGDTLLIDELDTGLHHTTLVKVWKLVLTVARERVLQVFATSHSQDCLRALAELHAVEPALTEDFMLHYIDKDEPRAKSFTAAEVETAIAHDLELRG